MLKPLQPDLGENAPTGRSLPKGIAVGAVGGLVGTIVMDLFGLVVLLIAGGPDTISFSLIGDAAASFFSRIGIEIPGGDGLGILLHYLIGLLLGISFGVIISLLTIRNLDRKKGVALGILYVEAMSIPMLTSAAIVLQMSPIQTASYFITSFIMHLVFGGVLGICMFYGLRFGGAARGMPIALTKGGRDASI